MSVRAILLRVLLSVALVLNGATGAAAAVHMQMPQQEDQAHAPRVAESPESSSADMPCHQQQATGVSGKAPLAAADSVTPKPKHSTPDCCKSSSCNCVCMHAAQAPPAPMFIQTLLVDHSLSIGPLLPGHPSPALPHLIRPPIG